MSAEPEETDGTVNTEPDNINVGLIATVTVVGALLVVAIAAALTALVRAEAARYGDEVGAFANLGEVKRLKESQQGTLAEEPKWADREKGLVSIPIDRSMQLVVADLQRNPALATPAIAQDEDEKKEADGGADSGSEEPEENKGAVGAAFVEEKDAPPELKPGNGATSEPDGNQE